VVRSHTKRVKPICTTHRAFHVEPPTTPMRSIARGESQPTSRSRQPPMDVSFEWVEFMAAVSELVR
jgi:hypothetical protein